jgi:hypothetical protein
MWEHEPPRTAPLHIIPRPAVPHQRLPAALLAVTVAVAPLATPLAAQAGTPVDSATVASPNRAASPAATDRPLLLAINPIGAIFGWYAINAERALDASQTVGVSVELTERGLDESDDGEWDVPNPQASVTAHYRYYPRSVFRGLSLDGQLGWARMQDLGDFCFDLSGNPCSDDEGKETASAVHFGFEAGWNWLLGANDRLHVGVGVGARRYILTGGDRLDDETAFVRPTGRFSIGVRF